MNAAYLLASLVLSYPVVREGTQEDDYHGTTVLDPYRHLEDSSSEETIQWVEAERLLAASYLEKIPGREAIFHRLEALWHCEKYDSLMKKGGHYFLSKNNGFQDQSVMYSLKSLEDVPEVLIDPSEFSDDGTASLHLFSPSPDGKWVGYSFSQKGSDWQEIRIRNIETKKDLDDRLLWIKFSEIQWDASGAGFYYCRYEEPSTDKLYASNDHHRVFYHKLGASQSEDLLIFESPKGENWLLHIAMDAPSNKLLITAGKGCDCIEGIFCYETGQAIKELIHKPEGLFDFIGIVDSQFLFFTNFNAPHGQVIGVTPGNSHWNTIVAEREETLVTLSLVGNRLVAKYLKDAHSQVLLFFLDGRLDQEISLPGIGTATGFSGARTDLEMFYSYSSFITPPSLYRYDFNTNQSHLVYSTASSTVDFETNQVFYDSLDGTKIPMFLCHKKGISFSGNQPVYLYGYGGFNISVVPTFSPETLAWIEMGGVLAIANLRGGGEYGRQWHEAGKLGKKQTVFDDFIAAAKWLIQSNITQPSKLAIGGRSNGGLLVGACLNQHPELFGAALPMVGVMDMLRYQKFTIGWAWQSEYGSSDNPDHFPFLFSYSPLHNIQRKGYPATLIFTADHDDRVVPAHSFKYTAALQKAQTANSPILLRVDKGSGHGAGRSVSKLIAESADRLAFLKHHLKVE